jgi:hypothetical protein
MQYHVQILLLNKLYARGCLLGMLQMLDKDDMRGIREVKKEKKGEFKINNINPNE